MSAHEPAHIAESVSTFVPINRWYCTVHDGISENDDGPCDWRDAAQKPCDLHKLGYLGKENA
jgi:hypothetical protein